MATTSWRIGYFGDFDPAGLCIEQVYKNGNGKVGYTTYTEGLEQIIDKDYEDVAHQIDWDRDWVRLGLTEDDFNDIPVKARVPVKVNRKRKDGTAIKDDSNAKAFIAKHGKRGAEVEALGFEELQSRAQKFIDSCTFDWDAWETSKATEKDELAELAGE